MVAICVKHNRIKEYDPKSGMMICPDCDYDTKFIKAEYEILGWEKLKSED